MKPAPFDYIRAESLGEALAALAELGEEARILAGGQSLIAMLNMRLAQPEAVIDISRLESHRYIRAEDGVVEVGAVTTQADLQAWPDLAARLPLLALALPWVGHAQTRNKGTLCGSIAHADPSAELPLCLAALDGEVKLESARGVRTLPAGRFQTGLLTTACAPDEMITAVRWPAREAGCGYGFREFAVRHGDFAIVAVAAVARESGIRVAVGGVATQPVVRDWPPLDGAALDEALNELAWALGGDDDQHASARYRRDLVRRLGRHAIEEAMSCRD